PSSPSRSAMVAAGSLGRRLLDVEAGMVVTLVTEQSSPKYGLLGAETEKSAPETAATLWQRRFWAAPARSFRPCPNTYKRPPERTSPSFVHFLAAAAQQMAPPVQPPRSWRRPFPWPRAAGYRACGHIAGSSPQTGARAARRSPTGWRRRRRRSWHRH